TPSNGETRFSTAPASVKDPRTPPRRLSDIAVKLRVLLSEQRIDFGGDKHGPLPPMSAQEWARRAALLAVIGTVDRERAAGDSLDGAIETAVARHTVDHAPPR
ncbi:MAG TPA: hypothetical protein VFW46_23460, partial [Stellaceae bacterium]|nr:hypothetical protein [Stellaceae bacterium]